MSSDYQFEGELYKNKISEDAMRFDWCDTFDFQPARVYQPEVYRD